MLEQLNPLNNFDIRFYDYTSHDEGTCRVCVNNDGFIVDTWYVPIELVKRKKNRDNISVWLRWCLWRNVNQVLSLIIGRNVTSVLQTN